MVSDQWNNSYPLLDNLQHLATYLLEWNYNVFGNIHYKKKRILARLNGIQKAHSYGRNPFLEELEKSLQQELQEILGQEEIIGFQKSRATWIRDGD